MHVFMRASSSPLEGYTGHNISEHKFYIKLGYLILSSDLKMGKRGPKPGHGGAPIQFDDEFHREHRRRVAESRKRVKQRLTQKF